MFEADAFLSGPTVPYARFPNIGVTVTGIVADEPRVVDQVDINGIPRRWDDGNKMVMLAVHLETDDGLVLLPVKGSKAPESRSMRAAVSAAITASGADGLRVGGRLRVTYIGDGKPHKPGMTPPKLYRATYEAPGTFDYFDGGAL